MRQNDYSVNIFKARCLKAFKTAFNRSFSTF
nr:MAG TPA: hypothetical protein [Caudoviricetes sp.]